MPEIEIKAKHLLETLRMEPAILEIPATVFQYLFRDDTDAPTLHPLLKDHKPEFPNTKIRPVQPITGSAIEKIDVLVSEILVQILPFLKYRVGNSEQLRTNINEINKNLPDEYLIASLDVVNMYPNVPTDQKALNVVKECIIKHWDNLNMYGFKADHVIAMLEFIFQNTHIKYGEKHYIQTEGIGTGLHSSGA